MYELDIVVSIDAPGLSRAGNTDSFLKGNNIWKET